ncbi:AAA family ATPase [Eubacteriales bacterium OttesenSCG-928-N13]|nr:AAA family ATPase [Eubacteriales bacterium OttesenSCG-928-N13]
MKLSIDRLVIRHFKGIEHSEVDFGCEDAAICGDNATGKTSVFDAFLWLLFGKDSTGRSDFGVKPYDESGTEIHNLETSVEGAFLLDGRTLTLRHMMSEDWVKQRGQAERVFKGNSHTYWINDVATSASDYKRHIESIAEMEVFRLITNPLEFNTIHWEKRRQILLKLSPVDIDSVLLANPKYSFIGIEMEKKQTNIDGLKKSYKEQKRRVDDELTAIPIKVSEVKRMLGDMDGSSAEKAVQECETLESELETIEGMLIDESAAERLKKLTSEIAQTESVVRTLKNQMFKERLNARQSVQLELSKTQTTINAAKGSLPSAQTRLNNCTDQIARYEKQLADLRNEWYECDKRQMAEPEVDTLCPTCNQSLPTEMIEAAKVKAAELFAKQKERELSEIGARGVRLKRQKEDAVKAYSDAQAEVERLEPLTDESMIPLLTGKVAKYDGEPDYSSNSEVVAAEKVLTALMDRLNASQGIDPEREALKARREGINTKLDELNIIIARKDQYDLCVKRIEELEERQQELGIQLADIERAIILIEQFITERCRALEESINTLFPTVRWKLFEVQINTGIKDTCICLIDGVPFSDANNAAKINAGLEIIDVLSRFYDASVPVFVDNAEAVNQLANIESQRVALTVTTDNPLRIVRGSEKMEVA